MFLLSESKSRTAVEALSGSAAQRGPMAAELDEYADAYFLSNRANRLQDVHRELKEFSWIVSPLMVAAGAIVGNLGSLMLGMSDDPLALISGGAAVGMLGAVGFNLDIFRRGRRATEARARYDALEAELFPRTEIKEINP